MSRNLFAPDGGLRVSLKRTERERKRKIIQQRRRGGRYRDNKR